MVAGLLQYPATPEPSYPVEIRPVYEVSILPYVGGSEQRIIRAEDAVYNITLRYNAITFAQRDAIFGFFWARRGAAETFFWVNPFTAVSHVVRFTEDVLDRDLFQHRLWRHGRVEMVEVFHP